MPNGNCPIKSYKVKVFPLGPKIYLMKALIITFDGNLHVEAATWQHIQGKVLPGCLPWQKILFHFDAFLLEDSSTGKVVLYIRIISPSPFILACDPVVAISYENGDNKKKKE